VIEPEVLPPEGQGDEPQKPPTAWQRLENAFGPIIGGLVIDLVDFTTFGPLGFAFGMVLGGLAAWWVCSIYHLPLRQRLFWACLAGLYCTVPNTELIPIATLIGAAARFAASGKKKKASRST
jgi:hypothetical protein